MKKILIVDDDQAILEAVKIALMDDYAVYLEQTAEECLRFIEMHSIDLIVMDYNLGDNNGLALAKAIFARYPDMTIILISGNMDKTLKKQASAFGIQACFSKPFVLEDLLNAIKALLDESDLRWA